jgi:hypothetical protein
LESKAIELDKDIRELALDDEDLRPLWDWILGLPKTAAFLQLPCPRNAVETSK